MRGCECVRARACICVRVYVRVRMCGCLGVSVYICVSVYIYVYWCVCVWVCECVYVYMSVCLAKKSDPILLLQYDTISRQKGSRHRKRQEFAQLIEDEDMARRDKCMNLDAPTTRQCTHIKKSIPYISTRKSLDHKEKVIQECYSDK